jgi:hypothetical protein
MALTISHPLIADICLVRQELPSSMGELGMLGGCTNLSAHT